MGEPNTTKTVALQKERDCAKTPVTRKARGREVQVPSKRGGDIRSTLAMGDTLHHKVSHTGTIRRSEGRIDREKHPRLWGRSPSFTSQHATIDIRERRQTIPSSLLNNCCNAFAQPGGQLKGGNKGAALPDMKTKSRRKTKKL